jgi:triosephosphate isomerase
MAEGTRIEISSQDLHWEEQGAFTGEVSVKMLLDVGCTYTIIGHSERRQYFCETDETVEKKTRAAVAGGLKAIVCVGEILAERDAGQAVEVVRRQVRNGLGRLTEANLSISLSLTSLYGRSALGARQRRK